MKRILCFIMAMLILTTACLTACDTDNEGGDETTTTTVTTTTGNQNPGNPPPENPPTDPVYDPDLGLSDAVIDDGVTVSGDIKVLLIGDARAAGTLDYLNDIALEMGYENVKVGCVYSYFNANISNYDMGTAVSSDVRDVRNQFMYKTRTNDGEWVYENYSTNIRTSLLAEDWDHVIVTESYYDAALASYNTTDKAYLNNNAKFKSVVNGIKQVCTNAKVYFQTCPADVSSDHEQWYVDVMKNLETTTKDAAIDGVIPVATAVQNFYENMPIYSDVTSAMARYTSSMMIASSISGKNPASVTRDIYVFDYKIGTCIMREAIQNAKNTPLATTDTEIVYNTYIPEDDDNKYAQDSTTLQIMDVEILNYYHNAGWALSMTFDDGDIASAEICAEILKKYDICGSFYIQVNLSMTNQQWARWEKLVRDYGNWVSVGSHDYTGYQGRTDVQSTTVDTELANADITQMTSLLNSYSILSSISPNESVVSYCTPGAGVKYMNRQIQMKFSIFAGDRVSGNRYGARANTPYAADFTEEDFYWLGSGNLVSQNGSSNFASHTGTDGSITFAQQNSGWFIPLQHGLFPKTDTNQTTGHTAPTNDEGITGYVDISRENLEAYCQAVVSSGAWFGSYNNVLKYVREAKTAQYEILWANDNTIAIKLTCPLDRRFNHPLSLRVKVPTEWINNGKFSIRQGNYVVPVAQLNKSSKVTKIYIPDAVPNGEIIYIERNTK